MTNDDKTYALRTLRVAQAYAKQAAGCLEWETPTGEKPLVPAIGALLHALDQAIAQVDALETEAAPHYTQEERRERHRLAQQAYETRERGKRGEPAPLPYKDKLNLGTGPARQNRKAYNQAYYQHTKKTGNPLATND